jgi:hypothetical protein
MPETGLAGTCWDKTLEKGTIRIIKPVIKLFIG